MFRPRILPLALVLTVAAAACSSDDDPTDPNVDPVDALVGSYSTQSFTYTAIADPELTIDLAQIPPGLGITSLVVSEDARFQGSATLEVDGQFQTIEANGTLTDVTTSSLTINFEGLAGVVLPNPLPVSYTLTGNVLSFTANVNFDFSVVGGPPGDTPSTLTAVLLRS